MENYRKSSFSMNNGNCVEVADGVAVRDTQDINGFVLTVSPNTWMKFVATMK